MTIGIVGTGFIAGVHCRSLLKLSGVTVAAVCGTSMDKARAFIAANNLAGAQPYVDFDGMLARTPLEALYVCLPPAAHHGQVVAAARKGMHLFLEKPLALHLRDAGDMVTAIAQAGVQSQVGFHLRFRKAVRAMKALADAAPRRRRARIRAAHRRVAGGRFRGRAGRPAAELRLNRRHSPQLGRLKKIHNLRFTTYDLKSALDP